MTHFDAAFYCAKHILLRFAATSQTYMYGNSCEAIPTIQAAQVVGEAGDQQAQCVHAAWPEKPLVAWCVQSIDTDMSGTITVEELKVGLREQGSTVTEAELNELVLKLDADESGTIDYEARSTYAPIDVFYHPKLFAVFPAVYVQILRVERWLKSRSGAMLA